jgi:RNA polymerase sigma factor (sigma-70 family)
VWPRSHRKTPEWERIQAEISVDALFATYYLKLVRMAVHLVDNQASAEDVVQDVFTDLQRRGVHITHNDPGSFLRTCVINMSRSALRRRAALRNLLGRLRTTPAPQDVLSLRDEQREMLRAISRLPRRQREVVVLRYYEGLQGKATVDLLGISLGAVASSLDRALTSLRRLLEDKHEN